MKTLDELLAQAELFAEQRLRKCNHLQPAFFWLGKDGPSMAVPASFADDADKNAFVSMARLFCVAHAATACVTAVEAWVSTKSPKETMPSEDLERKECIILMGETCAGPKHKMLPIVRSSNENFFGFGDPVFSEGFTLSGRFTHMLPSKQPDAATQQLAQVALALQYGRIEDPGREPKQPRAKSRFRK